MRAAALLAERARRLREIEAELDARLDFVDVLPARPARAARAQLEGARGNAASAREREVTRLRHGAP